MQPPFYPLVAEQKGATSSQYGFVFGILNLTAFIFAPIFGTYGSKIGSRTLFYIGSFSQGFIGLLFGLLQFVNSTWTFIVLSYILRFLNGVADAAVWGASLAILLKLFPDKVTTLMSYTEMCLGLGYILGPPIGSFLFELGGFILPFETMGMVCLIAAFGVYMTIPQDANPDPKYNLKSKKSISINDIVRNPTIFLPFVDNFLCYASYGMIEAMLEPFMRNTLGTGQRDVTNAFLISGAVYLPFAPIAGWVGYLKTYFEPKFNQFSFTFRLVTE